MNVAPRTAVSLYVALAVHVLLLLGLALSPPSQNSAGPSLGLSIPGAGLDAVERRVATGAPPASSASSSAQVLPADVPAPAATAVPTVRVEPDAASTEAHPRRAKPGRKAEPAKSRPEQGTATSRTTDPDSAEPAGLIGGGGGHRYYARLRAHLARFRHELPGGLPAATARIRVRVSPDGWISELELLESSGLPVLDAEAMDLLRRAAPLPPPPEGRATRLIVPVSIGGPD